VTDRAATLGGPRDAAVRRRPVGLAAATGAVLAGSAALVIVQAALIAEGHVLAGQIANGLLVLVFANGAWIVDDRGSQPRDPLAAALGALGIVALIPLVSAGLPLREFSQSTAILLMAGAIGVSTVWLAAGLRIDIRPLLRMRMLGPQLVVASTGIPLGLIAYLQGAPSLPTSADRGLPVVLAAAALAPAVEELAFRGVLQQALQRLAGRLGVLVATGLFAATYLGAGSASLILTVTLAGAIFAAAVTLTHSLLGAIAGHVAFAMGASVVWPAAFGLDRPVDLDSAIWASAVSTALGAACALILLYGRGRSEAR
jgi:membrane protease YdiL (CAAX protease family)